MPALKDMTPEERREYYRQWRAKKKAEKAAISRKIKRTDKKPEKPDIPADPQPTAQTQAADNPAQAMMDKYCCYCGKTATITVKNRFFCSETCRKLVIRGG